MKSNEELLEYIEKLEKEVKLLKDAHVKDQEILRKQEYMLQEKDLKIYETNMKLEQALLIIQNYEEKYNIERTKVFIPKTEKLEDIVINETEEVIDYDEEADIYTCNKEKLIKERNIKRKLSIMRNW